MTIFNIRGTNGSGKTTIVRKLIEECKTPIVKRDCYNPEGKKVGEWSKIGWNAVIGKYSTTCGGCDTIKTQADAKRLITIAASASKNVIFEGILISTIYQPWSDFAHEVGGMTWLYLDTPLETCLANIYKRNGGKKINEELVINKYASIKRTAAKAAQDGHKVVVLNYENAFEQFKELIK